MEKARFTTQSLTQDRKDQRSRETKPKKNVNQEKERQKHNHFCKTRMRALGREPTNEERVKIFKDCWETYCTGHTFKSKESIQYYLIYRLTGTLLVEGREEELQKAREYIVEHCGLTETFSWEGFRDYLHKQRYNYHDVLTKPPKPIIPRKRAQRILCAQESKPKKKRSTDYQQVYLLTCPIILSNNQAFTAVSLGADWDNRL